MRKIKLAAVIDIGSNIVRMHIAQWDGKNVTLLDKLEKPTMLGQEVFSTGNISFDTVRSLSATLSHFSDKAKEYGITAVHAVAKTALREATNQAYILDHIATRNKIVIDVLEDTEVSALLIEKMKCSGISPVGKLLMIHGGTGTTDFALLNNEEITLSHSIQTGLLKIAEMLREVSGFSHYIEYMAEEYLDIFLSRANRMDDLLQADSIVFGSTNLQPLFDICGMTYAGKLVELESKKVLKIYNEYRPLSIDQICSKHNLNQEQSGILYAMFAMIAAILKKIGARKLCCIQINLGDAMLDLLLKPGARRRYNQGLLINALCSALDLAERYHCDIVHGRFIAEIALKFFDTLKSIHDFSSKQRFLLNIACILHEAGHYTNAADSQKAAFNLIKDAQIFGLCVHQTMLAAHIISPQNLLGIERGEISSSSLNEDDTLFVAKMHALFHLAETLDFSHMQKITEIDVKLDKDRLIIHIGTQRDFTLEQLMFRQSASLFQEIFGIEPQLKIKHSYNTEVV